MMRPDENGRYDRQKDRYNWKIRPLIIQSGNTWLHLYLEALKGAIIGSVSDHRWGDLSQALRYAYIRPAGCLRA